jgi:carbamoyl-phosphate synthase large subunit
MDEKIVLVTGIGGNVGQGIIRNIKNYDASIKVVGTNIIAFSSGNHLCDLFYKVPYARDKQYISVIQGIINQEKVNLIIPSTDAEVYYLSMHRSEISCEVAVSNFKTAATYFDKYDTFQFLHKSKVPFAASYLPSTYKNEHLETILKPRKGRGSRGIELNPKILTHVSDEEYMIQELHMGVEITTAFYVNKHKHLHGYITFERSLENGTTTHCKVVDKYDEKLQNILERIIAVSEIKGSANIQSIVTTSGNIIPFEINCRISGTNSIRANFGFKDVQYTIEEYLLKNKPTSPNVKKGIATRILMDVIYEEATEFEVAIDNGAKYYIY